jgi:hypothetical protein
MGTLAVWVSKSHCIQLRFGCQRHYYRRALGNFWSRQCRTHHIFPFSIPRNNTASFCSLSLQGRNSYVDCGHNVCTRHINIHLRDQTGADNLVMGCRNTVFSAQAQSGVHSLMEWVKSGANRFRIELNIEGRLSHLEVSFVGNERRMDCYNWISPQQ